MAPNKEYANRSAKWRANLKGKKDYETHLKKDGERKKKARAELKVKRQGDLLLDASEREKQRERMKSYRHKLKKTQPLKSPDPHLGFYSCTKRLRKAVIKSMNVLPKSPSKKRAVVRQLINETFVKNTDIALISPKTFKKRISQVTEDKVVKFYLSDGISWQAPGEILFH